MPTGLGSSLGSGGPWLRSSGAHWDRELAVDVQQCPLRSRAGEKARRRRRRRRRKARRAILKSNNPHLAGEEHMYYHVLNIKDDMYKKYNMCIYMYISINQCIHRSFLKNEYLVKNIS